MKNLKAKYFRIVMLCIGIFLAFILIDRFTIINLHFGIKNSKNIPDLSQKIEDDFYIIERVTKGNWNEIRYDAENDYYIVAQDKNVTKLNHQGKVAFTLDLNEKDLAGMPDFMEYHRPSPYVISWYGIYDLSKDEPHLEKFDTQYNQDGAMASEEWLQKFNALYESSEVVLWGYKKALDKARSHPLYFKQGEKWKILYTSRDISGIKTNGSFTGFKLKEGKGFISDRFHRLYLLKDIQDGDVYSDYNNFSNKDDNTQYIEDQLEYGKEIIIQTISFEKDKILDAPYSFIPAQFGGTVVHRMKLDDSNFVFKTKGIKGAGFQNLPLETFIYLFTVPTKFKSRAALNFLYYKYPTNWNSDENEGVYVIRRK